MCGIAGYIGTRNIPARDAALALSLLERRGPDGAGEYRHTFKGRNLCLLHTRLSIIDLDERSVQPMQRGHHVLSFNGELYNYVELRKNLVARGEMFTTTSDTEVVLASLRADGVEALDAMEGMWAFACYNEDTGLLMLCRDRFGEKPLYLHEDSTGLYFASEIKVLMALSGKCFAPDMRHLRRYLVNGYKALYKQRACFFEDVDELPSATIMHVLHGAPRREEKYWRPVFAPEESMTFEEAVDGTRERLLRSMELRLRSDVPLAFCQSGGVDSSALISIAKRVFDYDVHGFTVVNKDARYDEWDIVQETISELGLKHTPIFLKTDDFLSNMHALVQYHDAPVCTISYYAQWLLLKSVAEHGYKVSVSGTAADELFTGYYDHHNMFLAELYGTDGFETARNNWNTHIKPIVRNPFLQDPKAFVNNPNMRDHIYLKNDVYAGCLVDDFKEEFIEERYCDGLLRNRMLNELFHESVPVILHEDDLNAMHCSIENRSPFLDRALFDHCYSIPTRHLIRDGYNKTVLREAVRGIAPDCVVNTRRKVGFNAPLFDFLDIEDADVRGELLADSPVFDLVQRDKIAAMLVPGDLSNSDSKFLFSFIGCKMFLEGACDV
ncbi:MAG: asparagine synthase (glutamine-hydrolyzing) [Pseudodesulfovibrio sp.]